MTTSASPDHVGLEPYELADPGRLLIDVRERGHALRPDDAFLVLVHHPSTSQTIRGVQKIALPPFDAGDDEGASQAIRERVAELDVPVKFPIEYSIVTVVVRRGMTIFSRHEERWFYAWRYANAHVDAFTADIVLITEHDWTDFMSGLGGDQPRAQSS